MKKAKQKNKGFSLLELIVSVALFTIAIMTGAGLVLAISTAQKKAVSLQEIQDNIGFAFEAMSREIRTGTNYYCGEDNNDLKIGALDVKDCPIGGSPDGGIAFSFVNQLGDIVVYRVTLSGQLEKSSDGGTNFLFLTSDKVNINNIKFYVHGSDPDDVLQPKVTIVLNAKTGEKFVLGMNLQTTLSQRALDY